MSCPAHQVATHLFRHARAGFKPSQHIRIASSLGGPLLWLIRPHPATDPRVNFNRIPYRLFLASGCASVKAWDLTRSGFLKTRTPQRSSPHISTCFTAAGFRGLVGRGCIQTMGEGEDELGRRSENWRNCFCHLLPPKHPKVPNTSQARKDHAVALLHQRCHQQGKDRSPFI